MGLDCIKCEGRGKFLAALGIDKEAFDKKYAKPMKVKAFEKSEKTVPDSRLKKSQLEEQASQMTKSLQALVDDGMPNKYLMSYLDIVTSTFFGKRLVSLVVQTKAKLLSAIFFHGHLSHLSIELNSKML